MAVEITNTLLDGEVTGENPDAGGDFYLVGDHNRDMAYSHAKVVEALKHISDSKTNFQILYGGVVSDSGSGQIDISAGVAIGKDASGNLKLIEIPALTNISLPTGWNDGRQIWVIGEHKYVITGAIRNHDETSEAYHYIATDSYKGSTVTNDLFTDVDPTGNAVIWGSFKMATTTYTDMSVRSQMWFGQNGIPGILSGSLKFNSTTTPPIVTSGVREVKGINYKNITDTTLVLATHNFPNSITSFDTYQWYRVTINKNTGAFNYIHAFDTTSAAASGTVSNIAVAAGVATITCNSTTGIVTADKQIAVISVSVLGSGTMTNLVGRATLIDGTHFSVPTSYAGTSPGAVTATFVTYYRIQTLHGTLTNVTTDTDVEKFTPSPLFCAELNGYYLDINGVPTSSAASAVYRTLGVFYVHAGPSVEYVNSYRSGFDKNDNRIQLATGQNSSAAAGVSYRFTIPTQFEKLWGNDYVATDDATNKFIITLSRKMSYDESGTTAINSSSSGNTLVHFRENGVIRKTANINIVAANAGAIYGSLDYSGIAESGMYLDWRCGSIGLNTPTIQEISVVMELI